MGGVCHGGAYKKSNCAESEAAWDLCAYGRSDCLKRETRTSKVKGGPDGVKEKKGGGNQESRACRNRLAVVVVLRGP